MIPKIAALAILLAIICFVLSELGFRSKKAFSSLAFIALILLCVNAVSEITPKFTELSSLSGIRESAETALKVVFSGYVFGIASDVSAELGEGGIANAVTLGGRLEIALIIMPYLMDVISFAVELI